MRPLPRPVPLLTALISLLVLAGCASASSGGSATAASEGPWTYTDDLGTTVTLDHQPTKIAGLTDVLASLINYGIDPVAAFGWSSVEDDPRFENYDTSTITTLGATYGEIDEEKLVTTAPDLIVTTVYPTDEKGTLDDSQPLYGFNDLTQQETIEKIAPVVAIYMGGDGSDVIDSVTALATALGADQATMDTAKAAYDTASQTLKDAAAASNVTVTSMYADADGVYVVKPDDEPVTQLYESLGVTFFDPTPEGYYWGIYSWENAGQVGGDLILLQDDGYSEDEVLKQPTLAGTPAFEAGQVEVYSNPGLDYVSQAAFMTQLAQYITDAQVVSS